MATNGMTINGLNPLSALTADDKIPVWDTGASGEPTKEITAQNMANSVKSLASLPNTTEMNAAIAQSTAYTDVTVGTITINSHGYADIRGFIPSGITPIQVVVAYFGATNGAIAVTANGYYVFGAPNTTISNTVLRYFYHG